MLNQKVAKFQLAEVLQHELDLLNFDWQKKNEENIQKWQAGSSESFWNKLMKSDYIY